MEDTNLNTETIEQTTEEQATTQVEETKETKGLQQEEVNRIVQERLARERSKWEKDYTAKLEAEKKEAERLAKLSQAEKEKELMKKQQEELGKREKEIALREMKLEAVKILNEKELPIDFIDLLTTDNADSTKSNIETFEKAFRTAVEKAVDNRIKGSSTTPKVSTAEVQLGLNSLREKAQKSGKIEDRVAYAKAKKEMEKQQIG